MSDLQITVCDDSAVLIDRISAEIFGPGSCIDESEILSYALFRLGEDLKIVRQDPKTGAIYWTDDPRQKPRLRLVN